MMSVRELREVVGTEGRMAEINFSFGRGTGFEVSFYKDGGIMTHGKKDHVYLKTDTQALRVANAWAENGKLPGGKWKSFGDPK